MNQPPGSHYALSPNVQHGSLLNSDMIGVIAMRIVDLPRLCQSQVVTTQLLNR